MRSVWQRDRCRFRWDDAVETLYEGPENCELLQVRRGNGSHQTVGMARATKLPRKKAAIPAHRQKVEDPHPIGSEIALKIFRTIPCATALRRPLGALDRPVDRMRHADERDVDLQGCHAHSTRPATAKAER
ncbi:hypothetical protein [Paracoccus sp. C2R09]|uniref:hypothetical protein n=1 Tax=Paracoccus sp. C2R09 TaxID=2839896 RepID=UPI001C0A6183|nr:hypothetical protein [Paracoccus sp. C2R09]MBU2956263.1 hypothetical protein [Paracoccus sp. C2R09]